MKKFILFLASVVLSYTSCIAQAAPDKNTSNQVVALTSTSQKTDTLQALNNLFQRKRKGAVWRSAIFGGIATAQIIGLINYKSPSVTINQGGSSQRIPLESGPAPFNYVLLGFTSIMTITGFTQYAKYNGDNQQKAIEDYKAGKLSPAIVLKLKKKDFKTK